MKTNIIVKTDKATKEKAQRYAREIGLTLSDVVNVSVRNFIETGSITATVPYRMTKKLERTIAKAEQELAAGKVRFSDSADEFLAELKS
jgi:addiction module RelB/DinJ family antitoxin